MRRSVLLALSVTVLGSGCGSSDAVEVQPLPSLEQSSPEARAGVPAIAGSWRFAGWELAENDSASLAREDLPRFGVIAIATQKRDSLAGQYVIQAGRAPLYGEVRRDSVVALVGVFGPGDLRYLAGRVTRDTVWMELSSLTEPGVWPSDARAAFVRTAVAEPFVRLRGAVPPPSIASVDTLPPAAGPGLPPAGGRPGGHHAGGRRAFDAGSGRRCGPCARAPAAPGHPARPPTRAGTGAG